MRYWIVLFLLLGACSAPYHIPGYELSETIDFRRFEGFLFSTTDLNRDYEPLGVVTITHIPQATRQKSEREAREKGERLKNMYSDGAYLIEQVQVEEVLEKLKKQAQALGAEGIIDLKFESKLH